MEYGYYGPGEARGRRFQIPRGQATAGQVIGIMHLDLWYPFLPGNVVNATTYPFAVRFKNLEGSTVEGILKADSHLGEQVIQAGRELEREGVRAVIGACGYFANYQRELAEALDIPVFLSSLLQVPLIARSLKRSQKVGILCAHAGALGKRALENCGITPDIPTAIIGMEDQPEFNNILQCRGEFDYDRLEQELVDGARRLVARNPEVGAVLLECSDMPPFAAAIQRAVRLPVFDFITMIKWIQSALVQRPYDGVV
jgi:Asp/Glu/hydantoin racemase